ncbi:MAG: hypothetical protein FWD92_03460 [Methanomassiliicoccaceae archaeon]|nr:hypothetical protein [Methanomassiliicoccaceae archaeon]
MTITEEINKNAIVEPVDIEAAKKYIGYASAQNEDDLFMLDIVKASRERLEDRLGRAIPRRTFVTREFFHSALAEGQRVTVELRKPLINVISVECTGPDGSPAATSDYSVRPGDGAAVSVNISKPTSEIAVMYDAGYDIVPEILKTTVLAICKAHFERSTDDVIGRLRNDLQKYWNENI